MTMPKAYEPMDGYKYQILCRYQLDSWEHCDYAVDRKEMNYLVNEYRLAYGSDYDFRSMPLPQKYWTKQNDIKGDI